MWEALKRAHEFGEGGEKKRVPYISTENELMKYAESPDSDIRYSVVRSKYAPIETQEIFVRDSSWVVRMALAWRQGISAEILGLLLCDPELPVREAAERNPLSGSILGWTAADKLRRPNDVRVIMASHPDLAPEAEQMLASSDFWLIRAIIGRRVCDEKIIVKLSLDDDDCVRMTVASNSLLPEDVALVLCNDSNEEVRWSLAGNPSISETVIAKLGCDTDKDVRKRLEQTMNRKVSQEKPVRFEAASVV